jgi:hypothetical protein
LGGALLALVLLDLLAADDFGDVDFGAEVWAGADSGAAFSCVFVSGAGAGFSAGADCFSEESDGAAEEEAEDG